MGWGCTTHDSRPTRARRGLFWLGRFGPSRSDRTLLPWWARSSFLQIPLCQTTFYFLTSLCQTSLKAELVCSAQEKGRTFCCAGKTNRNYLQLKKNRTIRIGVWLPLAFSELNSAALGDHESGVRMTLDHLQQHWTNMSPYMSTNSGLPPLICPCSLVAAVFRISKPLHPFAILYSVNKTT